jgi:hypothetical protein
MMVHALMPDKIKGVVEEWSLFDIMCLIYVLKNWVINAFAVLSAFMYSSDSHEAQVILMNMRSDYKRNREVKGLSTMGLNIGNVVLSERAHSNLFQKGILKEMIDKYTKKDVEGENKKELS